MAKYQSSGFIQGIRGSMGDSTFYYWKGVPVMRKKPNGAGSSNTPAQEEIRRSFAMISAQWKNLSFADYALWEEYAKKYTKRRSGQRNGLVSNIGGKMSEFNAFVSTNQLLMRCGFDPIKKPVLGNIGKPSSPKTDLINLGVYKKEIKFNVWMPRSYPTDCIVQVYIKKFGRCYPAAYIRAIVPISTSPAQVAIDKIKLKEEGELVEKKLKDIGRCKLFIQLRTVAANGEFSTPSAIYRIEVNGDTTI